MSEGEYLYNQWSVEDYGRRLDAERQQRKRRAAVTVRLPRSLANRVSAAATASGQSVNDYVTAYLTVALGVEPLPPAPGIVTSGLCPKCGDTVATPAPANRCVCGQWVRNKVSPLLNGRYLYARRAPNGTRTEEPR